MDLIDIALFQSIAATGSLSAAARRLSMTPMTVSRRLAALETSVGARLFHRTTRALSLTTEGEALLPYADQLLATQEAALAAVSSGHFGLTGKLRITAPNLIGHSVVVPVLAALIEENPALKVDLRLSDAVIDIAGSGMDLAIRVSPLEPSEMVATKLADNPRILCASPAYLRRLGWPQTIEDLGNHSCIRLQKVESWPFIRNGALEHARIDGSLSTNTVDAVRAATLAGLGIAMMTYWDVDHDIRQGALERIDLSGAQPDKLAIWAVIPTRSQVPVRVRVLIEALKARLGKAFDEGTKDS